MTIQERRQHSRKRVSQPIKVLDESSDLSLGFLVDISLGGFMLLADQAMETNRVFQIRLEMPPTFGSPYLCFGAESLWQESSKESGKCWVGFQIIDISPENAKSLNRLIADFL